MESGGVDEVESGGVDELEGRGVDDLDELEGIIDLLG